ncbi:MAG: hypothetical protein ACR2JI_00195 [Mycobacterium sp.]
MAAVDGRDADKVTRIPLWFADKSKDTLSAEHWLRRVDTLRTTQGWSSIQTAGNAQQAFRGEAMVFLDYLIDHGIDITDWAVMRNEFLSYFGFKAHDTSRLTNLSVRQKAGEQATSFGFRVNATLREFAQSKPDRAPNSLDSRFQSVPANWVPFFRPEASAEEFKQLMVQQCYELATVFYEEGTRHYNDHLGRTIYLNGLLPSLQVLAKLQPSDTLKEAVEETKIVEKSVNGPLQRHGEITAVLPDGSDDEDEEDPEDPQVNAAGRFSKRYPKRQTRGNKGYSPSSRPTKNYGSMECWYCHKKNHMQNACRLRITRGASMVPRPRSVQEIELDRMTYQEMPEEEDDDPENDKTNDYAPAINALSLNSIGSPIRIQRM